MPLSTTSVVNVASISDSSLGWIGLVSGDAGLRRVTFGHTSRDAARSILAESLALLADSLGDALTGGGDDESLLTRLVEFASGGADDFHDIELDLDDLSRFQRRVIEMCRRIPYGSTCSYGELAERAGNPGAARAVGSVMAANRWPLVVPCHRVVQAGGNLGAYSAPQGVRMKRRLLDMEAAAYASG